ncbi:MAG: NAD-dependent epimerase/dehydratase family protein [Chloroflexota bacterium]
MTRLNAVTGAFGYTGKHIAQRLLRSGQRVITITGHPNRPNPFGDRVQAYPFHFDHPQKLASQLQGVNTLYNTYWVRFNYGKINYDQAVENTLRLIRAAKDAGVGRLVHISISNPDANSRLPYFRGKGLLEQAIQESGLSYAILRPTVVFGEGDILINNIAWFLRRFPLFIIPGNGEYRLQPIFVEDLAQIAVEVGLLNQNLILNATGAETFTFRELVNLIKKTTGSRAKILHLPPRLAMLTVLGISTFVRDVVLTRDEIAGLMENQLYTDSPPLGRTPLSKWLEDHAKVVGSTYHSELKRHYR